jgi:hypothetical protein
MSITKFDSIGFYFTFEYYLCEQKIDLNIISFMENNNVQYKYICFFDKVENNINYLVSSNFNNTYKIITISHDYNSECSENKIIINDDKTLIYYNSYKISISSNIVETEINNILNFTSKDISLQFTKGYEWHWFDEVPQEQIMKIYIPRKYRLPIRNLRILSILTQVSKVCINTKLDVSEFDMKKLFPNLKSIKFENEIIYES